MKTEARFDRLLPFIRAFSSLVYLDQNGIKFLADKYLLELEKTIRTDFLYFVSSSYFWGTWGEDGVRRSKKANGRVLLGQEWNEEPHLANAMPG